MRLHPWLLVVWLASVTAQSHNITRRDASSSKRVVCYYTNWSVYRPGTAKFTPQNINPYLCTHLIYSFGGLNKENGLRPYDKYQDIEQGGFAKFTGLKTYNKQLKTLLAIGGWNEGSARFSSLVADEERRAEFVKNVVRFLRQNHFDGLDLDWEYPAFRDGGKPQDRENYALLVQELREEFEKESEKTGRPRLLLTMAVPAGIEYIDKGYDVSKLNRYLDFMNILSYDYHSAFEPSVNHHAPLYPLEEESEYNFDTQLNIDYTVQHYVKLGADREKLVLGIPTYGRSYTLFNPLATEIGAPADGPGEQGDATREKGYLAYYEICENLKSNEWKVEKPNPKAMGPYAYKGNQWVGYDDEDIVKMKARYVDDNDLGGIMFWSIDNDDFRGKCSGKQYPLIEAGKEAMLLGSGSVNEVVPSFGSSSKKKGRPRPTSIPRDSSNSNRKSGDRNTGRRRKNKSRTSTTTTTTTTTTPKYTHPPTTPEPPTTPDPGSDFTCKDEGFFPHPRDCKKYFWCLDSGPSNLGIVAHQFTCPSGLFFNKVADSCDYARNVICKKNSKSESATTTKSPPTTVATSTTTRFRTTTTTTTTTTSKPVEEEYEYYDDEEEEGSDSEAGGKDDLEEEDPKAIQELIKLIKKLGGLEQLEKQLHLDEKGDSETPGVFSRSLYDRVLNRNINNDKALSTRSTTTSPATSPRYSSVFRNRPSRPQNEGLESTPHRYDRPDYVTIKRNKPEHKEEDLNEDDDFEEEENEEETGDERPSGPEYVTIRRQRIEKTTAPDITTPRYVTIHRKRPMNEEDAAQDEIEKNEDEELGTRQKTLKSQPNHFKETVSLDELDEPLKDVTEKESTTQKVNVFTSPRLRQRQPGTLYTPRNRSRATTTTTTKTTTDIPLEITTLPSFSRQEPANQRRVVKRRKYVPSGGDTSTQAPVLSSTRVEDDVHTTDQPRTELKTEVPVSVTSPRRVTFPRRVRPGISTTVTPVISDAQVQPSAVVVETHSLKKVDDEDEHVTTIDYLPDLANAAVAAITNLATQDTPLPGPILTTARSVRPTHRTTVLTTEAPATVPIRQALRPRPFSRIPTSSKTAPVNTEYRVRPATVRTIAAPVIVDYAYYDDDGGIVNTAPRSNKVKIHSDGYIECLDQGNFPHPFSCKKFISCAKMENGDLLGWEYTCPRRLSFDPIGGICNWSAGLGCKE